VTRALLLGLAALLTALPLAGARAQDRAGALVERSWDDAPPLLDDGEGGWASLRTATERSLTYYRRRPADAQLRFGPRTVSVRELIAGLERLLGFLEDEPTPQVLADRLRAAFLLYESSAGDGVLYTGYYEPVIEASLERRPGYEVPIYRVPPDVVKLDLSRFRRGKGTLTGRVDEGGQVVPYWSRRELWVEGRLAGRGLELAWAKSHVDAFFVEVQGSGSLRLPDGTLKRFGYAGSNGRGYRSIGKLLISEGKATRAEMSMQWLRAYLAAADEEERMRVLCHNQSVVFFRWLPGPPEGALGQPVTPGRSIATDLRLFPRGALAFVDTQRPVRNPDGTAGSAGPLRRLVLNQDTGGAIRGPGRVDLFWGRGPQAAESAGVMKHPGRLYFLVPKRRRLY
jgi:membrane-bound lytic murein transglycosylase A